MAEAGKRVNVEFGEIINRIRGDLSFEKAAEAIDYAVSSNAIRILETGKVGRERTVEAFARGFSDRICKLYGEEIRNLYGECSADTAAQWLLAKAGFPSSSADPWQNPRDQPGYWEEMRAVADLAATRAMEQALSLWQPSWKRLANPRFAETLRRLIPDASPAALSVRMGVSLPEAAAILAGVVPTPESLVVLGSIEGLPEDQIDELLIAAGHWAPQLKLLGDLAEAAEAAGTSLDDVPHLVTWLMGLQFENRNDYAAALAEGREKIRAVGVPKGTPD